MNSLCEQAGILPVRTLIVDDAPLMRKAIRQILSRHEGIEIIGTAVNGQDCLEKIADLKPDVVTLDIDMPVMNGITAVKNIMVRHQIPVVIISSLVQDGYFAFEALRLGVMDFIPKPSRVLAHSWEDEEELVRMRVRTAAGMQAQRMRRVRRRKKTGVPHSSPAVPPSAVVVMGTTLAGPNTIMHIVTQLPSGFDGAIIAIQEIHPRILEPFCSSFNEISPLEVVPVTESCPLQGGRVYMCSTFTTAAIEPSADQAGALAIAVTEAGRSPIDRLFESASHYFQNGACGVLLTGVGTDGAEGLRAIKSSGGLTIAQEQECCVYPNLVEHALREKVVDAVMSNRAIAGRLAKWATQLGVKSRHYPFLSF